MKAGSIVGGRYRLEALLASGGMGAVWRAEHTMSERRVALKLVRALGGLDEATVRRFKREATAPSAIGHPGIVEVLDAGVEPEEGLLFLAMELLEGESLRARLRRPETGRGEALRLVRALLDPLAAAHAGGWVHRDLKPENVFLAETPRSEAAGGGSGGDSGDGPGEVVKLLDFGLVRSVGGPSATLTGSAIGTPGYMAPEQAMSAKAVTARADVWAVGALLYEALAGAPPFEGETPHAQIMRACAEAHEPLVERVPGVPPALSALVDRCLAKVPDDRPADAAEVAAALDPILAELGDALAGPAPGRSTQPTLDDDEAPTVRDDGPPSSRPPSRAPSRRSVPAVPVPGSRWLYAAGVVLALGGGAAAWVGLGGGASERATPERPAAVAAAPMTSRDAAVDAPLEPATEDGAEDEGAAPLVRRRGEGWSIAVPERWEAGESAVPTIAGAWKAPQPLGALPPNAYVVVEPFEGSSREYADLGLNNMAEVARIHLTRDVALGPARGVEVDATFHATEPPFRGFTRAAVHEGMGYVIGCRGDPDHFEAYAETCRAILDSFTLE